jgi:hypothetical protein
MPKASSRLRLSFHPAGRGLEASISRTVSISVLVIAHPSQPRFLGTIRIAVLRRFYNMRLLPETEDMRADIESQAKFFRG